MKEAVEAEDYERASVLRDQIREIERPAEGQAEPPAKERAGKKKRGKQA